MPAESSPDGHGRPGIAVSAINLGELLVVPRGHAHPREARFRLGGLDQLPQEGLGGLELLEFDETADLRRKGRVMFTADMSRAVTPGSARYPVRSIMADVAGQTLGVRYVTRQAGLSGALPYCPRSPRQSNQPTALGSRVPPAGALQRRSMIHWPPGPSPPGSGRPPGRRLYAEPEVTQRHHTGPFGQLDPHGVVRHHPCSCRVCHREPTRACQLWSHTPDGNVVAGPISAHAGSFWVGLGRTR